MRNYDSVSSSRLLHLCIKNASILFVLLSIFSNFGENFNSEMFRFISLGSGSSGNGYVLQSESGCLLIDAGISMRTLKKRMRDNGLSLYGIKHILVTHDHADHVKAVGTLSNELNVDVYATAEVHQGIGNNYCVPQKIALSHAKEIRKNEPLWLGDFKITPFGVPHDSTDNVGFKIEHDGVTFCLMTDVGRITEELGEMIASADYLVIEANYEVEKLKAGPYPAHLKSRIMSGDGHLANHECGEALAHHATDRLRHVWLCHLSEENNHPELARKTVELVLRSYGIVVGKDFQMDVLKRSTPSSIYDLSPMESK